MPVGSQVVPHLDLRNPASFLKTWLRCASGPNASNIGLFHSKKHSIGGFSSVDIFFWFPLSIALSGLVAFKLSAQEA
ncbi:hypothetical protein HS088_TW04G00678 [Tripterygium wilfordii]|uniref:Uncharacterized protein n=1 Tax=Tripterygium wilfordii TaxID=458696 RepID=A0A7J7DQS7_TRIWF|nr:hypothetical protein HS088_TW04G00678 [Tripterygium wilfordii]